MTLKNELHLLFTGRLLSLEAYLTIFGCGVIIGVILAFLVWR